MRPQSMRLTVSRRDLREIASIAGRRPKAWPRSMQEDTSDAEALAISKKRRRSFCVFLAFPSEILRTTEAMALRC